MSHYNAERGSVSWLCTREFWLCTFLREYGCVLYVFLLKWEMPNSAIFLAGLVLFLVDCLTRGNVVAFWLKKHLFKTHVQTLLLGLPVLLRTPWSWLYPRAAEFSVHFPQITTSQTIPLSDIEHSNTTALSLTVFIRQNVREKKSIFNWRVDVY